MRRSQDTIRRAATLLSAGGGLVAAGALTAAGGCAHQGMVGGSAVYVGSVEIEGAQAEKEGAILEMLGTQGTPRLTRLLHQHKDYVPLDARVVEEDRTRLRNYYYAHGFFEATAGEPRVAVPEPGRNPELPRWAEVTFPVEEGPRSRVREARTVGLDALPATIRTPLETPLAKARGEPFSVPLHEGLEAGLKAGLTEQGYARVAVSGRADAFPEERAVDLSYNVVPGPPCVFGEVRVDVQGADTVPRRFVDQVLAVAPGAPYRSADLRRTQDAIFDLGMYSRVTVYPQLAGTTGSTVPVGIILREAQPRRVQVSGGFGFERDRDDAHLALTFEHRNLLRRLLRFTSTTDIGYAVLPGFFQTISAQAPVGSQTLELSIPRFPISSLRTTLRTSFKRDLEPGYQYNRFQGRAGFERRISRQITSGLSYNLTLFDLFNQDEALTSSSSATTEYPDGYFLSYLEQTLLIDRRNDPITTERGILASLTTDEAGVVLGGRYNYLKVTAELRGYTPLVPGRLILAGRIRGGWIHPLFSDSSTPLSERYFAGGATSVRGWSRNMLGPTVPAESCEPDATCDPIPVGGNVLLEAGPELRYYTGWGGGVVAFVDAGRVWADPGEIALDGVMVTAGGGLRYRSPVGPLRLDVGVRLNDDPALPEVPRYGFYLGLNEAF